MKPDDAFDIYSRYRLASVNMTIHKYDNMYNTAQKPEDYLYVGRSAVEVILSVMMASPITKVASIMDFGCGHGRVGRHLRAMFPSARIAFADADSSCSKFCADTFDGVFHEVSHDFEELNIDDEYDLIWLGSVFTHMDYGRMNILFKKLFMSLRTAGLLIGTFRGRKMYETYLLNAKVAERDADLIREFEDKGIAYKRYPNWPYDWGLSLVDPCHIVGIGQSHTRARLVAYTEVGWANAQDVAAWTNISPATIIR